mmetsp:Transcript_90321/g.254675  ORF Transcript_90321/g.254675 Transcript_90321/m.254675 type:complete len:286 (-) Transcript_90321:654-1511(-)
MSPTGTSPWRRRSGKSASCFCFGAAGVELLEVPNVIEEESNPKLTVDGAEALAAVPAPNPKPKPGEGCAAPAPKPISGADADAIVLPKPNVGAAAGATADEPVAPKPNVGVAACADEPNPAPAAELPNAVVPEEAPEAVPLEKPNNTAPRAVAESAGEAEKTNPVGCGDSEDDVNLAMASLFCRSSSAVIAAMSSSDKPGRKLSHAPHLRSFFSHRCEHVSHFHLSSLLSAKREASIVSGCAEAPDSQAPSCDSGGWLMLGAADFGEMSPSFALFFVGGSSSFAV